MAKTYFYNEITGAGKTVKDVSQSDVGINVLYTDGSNKEVGISGNGGGSGGVIGEIRQVTKLAVEAPKDIKLSVGPSNSIAFPAVEVLKLQGDLENNLTTMCEFENGDVKDFENNEFIIFDNFMKLRTERIIKESSCINYGTGFLTTFEIDKALLGSNITVTLTGGI